MHFLNFHIFINRLSFPIVATRQIVYSFKGIGCFLNSLKLLFLFVAIMREERKSCFFMRKKTEQTLGLLSKVPLRNNQIVCPPHTLISQPFHDFIDVVSSGIDDVGTGNLEVSWGDLSISTIFLDHTLDRSYTHSSLLET